MNNLETVKLRNNNAKLKEYTIDYPNKFESIKEAEQFADSLKGKILRLCKKNKWFCFVYIGISELDKSTGKIVKIKTNKKGRPLKTYHKKHKGIEIEFTKPHIHIYMLGLPGFNLSYEIQKYLFKHSNCISITDIKVKRLKCNRQLEYIKEQSIKHRVAYRDTDDTLLLNRFNRLNYLKGLDIKL